VLLLRALAVEPVVTLHHYTHPLWFWRGGGWENPESVEWFAALAAALARALPSVRYWVTLNEPIVFILGGYLGGLIPPGHTRFSRAAVALENLLRAHVAASFAIRDQIPDARVGMAHNMLDFAPDRPRSAFDRRLVAAAEALYNVSLVEAAATGRMRWAFPGEGNASFQLPDLPRATDFFGLNYYSRAHLRFRGLPGRVGEFFYRDTEGRGLTDTGWEVHPRGFHRILEVAALAGLPILVTENGIATRDDRLRRSFLREHVAILNHQRAAGLRIEGYFHWSLIDNFEWLEGFRPRFGLFEVDYATYARRRRPSADLFASLGRSFTGSRRAESSAEDGGFSAVSRT
jgi:beta-glucosidase